MIALYPGAFKPPHRGHFNVVKSLLDGSYNGSVYDKDDYKEKGSEVMKGQSVEKPKIDKVIVFIGGGERNGIDKEESTQIWDTYKEHLGNVEIVDGQKNPLFAARDYARENPNDEFVAVTGIRGEEDITDLRRVTAFSNTDNVQGLALASAPGSGVRATDFRNNILSGNLDKITDFFPEELSREEILSILTNLQQKIVSEIIQSNIDGFISEYFNEGQTEEGSSGTAIAPKSVVRSEDREKVKHLYNYLKGVVPSNAYVSFQQDRVVVSYKPTNPYDDKVVYEGIDTNKLTQYIGSILEYMLDQRMNIVPLPEVKIKRDAENAANFFGKTAYYDPNKKEIVLYVEGRHMKDVCRSFVHEMIHHIQNVEGRLGNIQTSNTNEDDHLLEIEKEAYLRGNITFRNWEDSIKNENKEEVVAEGRYDKISNQISSDLFKALKSGEESFYGNYYNDDLDFDVYGTFIANEKENYFSVDGDADYDETGEGNDSIQVIVLYNPNELPKALKDISFTLKDIVRHEIEHLTHGDSDNLKPGKYIEDDSLVRALIKTGVLPKGDYFKLAKEVDANIQGMYFRAKKEKRPFGDVVRQYLSDQDLPEEDYKDIINLMNKRLPALGIKQRL